MIFKNRKLKTTTEMVQKMYELSKQGKGDAEIGKILGCSEHLVEMSLARVAPDGRIMETIFGDRCNEPTYVRNGGSLGLEEVELPTRPRANLIFQHR
jgi:hypothetical protein